MPVGHVEELRGVLFEAYDGFGDKRLKDLGRDAPFIVDDRAKGDLDAKGNLFLWFCQIWIHVEAPDRVRVTLRGGVPEGTAVTEWFQAHGAKHSNFGLEVIITPANVGDLEALAKAFLAITKSKYEVKAYKYVVPRVAISLRKLRDVLGHAWA